MTTSFPSIVNRKIKVGLIGCGRISKNHLKSLQELNSDFELVGVCDIDPEALQKASTEYQVEGFERLEDLIQTTKPDMISVCTPSGLHPEHTITAAQLGCHVVCEKPMATKFEPAVKMIKTCHENNVRLFVVHQNRYNSTLQLLKQAIDNERFGRIYMVNLNVFWTRPQEYYDMAKWRGTWDLDGGCFMNQASHYIDLLSWMIGPIESLHAFTTTLERKIEAEDTGVLSVKWKHGGLGSVNVTMLTYPKNLEGSITILGEKGSVRVGGLAVNEIQHWEFSDSRPEDQTIADANYQTTSVYGFGHKGYYQNVASTLRGEAQPLVDGQEGLDSLEVLVATYQSAREGRRVQLPLQV